jgi:hypothetical protein
LLLWRSARIVAEILDPAARHFQNLLNTTFVRTAALLWPVFDAVRQS